MHIYDDTFYKYINIGSKRSASIVLPFLLKHLEIDSVIDFGCGQGAWLNIWESLGVKKVTGIDGDYVQKDQLLIDSDNFQNFDLSKSISLNKKYTLVQSLEVAEHIPTSCSEVFVENLVRHGDMVMFSAAVPGQGGEDHQNEQSYEFWRELFAKHDYLPIDYVRSEIKGNLDVESWYRYNIILYVKSDKIKQLPESLLKYQVLELAKIKDVSPWLYQLRKLVLRVLPLSVKTQLAVLKKNWFVMKAK